MPGASREAIDRAVMDGMSLVDVPGGHARPWVIVPRDEMALALRLHTATVEKHLAPLFRRGDLSADALRGVGAQVCRLLDEGPLTSSEIRRSIAHPRAEELLVGALRDLALAGNVRRFPADGRLDSADYVYELRHPEDRPDLAAAGDAAAVAANAAEHFLRHHGPASVEELTSWSQLTTGAAREALATVGAEPLTIPRWTPKAWLLPGDVARWQSFRGEGGDRVVLLPYRDPFVHVRRGPAVLARRPDAPVLDGTLKRVRIAAVRTLNHHTILYGADLVGIWEYDPDTESVVTRVWSADARLRRRVADAAADAEDFIRQQLGDAKLSAVDPPAKRARRLAFCRGK
jgi:hypothetical protein